MKNRKGLSMQLIEKPWGSEEIIEINEHYMVKKLIMSKGHRCSLQYHRQKQETIYMLSGRLRISIGRDQASLQARDYLPGESMTISPGAVHRMEAVENSVYLEASTPEIQDVVRLVDDYRRASA
jgi:mannose-6-phosphate isomerase